MEDILVRTPSKQYPVKIGRNVIADISTFLKEKYPDITKIMIITDEKVGELYLQKLKGALTDFSVVECIVPIGESAKTFEVYYQCLTSALEQKLDRKSLIISFGGGAVGDLSGFVAGTFMRGIPFIQVPTTILAHDSAVGGKVAINHPSGKNMIGVFYQPEAVFYDVSFLSSLPIHEKRSGFAEVIKHALIHDISFYDWLKKHVTSLESIDEDALMFFLTKGIRIKESFVSNDEKESGIRAHLNFGHTLGHAIEAEAGYGKITHGEAVVIGMIFALQLSQSILSLSFDVDELKGWLHTLGYQTELPSQLDIQSLIEKMKQDKKSIGQQAQFVLLEHIGSPRVVPVNEETLALRLLDF